MMANFDYIKNHVFESDSILKPCLIRLRHFTIICIYIAIYDKLYDICYSKLCCVLMFLYAFKSCCSINSLKIDLKINHVTFG